MLPVRLLLALLGGLALLLAFPGYDVWPLAFVGVGALALATVGTSVPVGLACGLLLGLSWYGSMFTWAGTYAGVAPWLAMSVVSALYPAALGGLLALLQRGGAVRPFVAAAAWGLMDYARSVTPFDGFGWGRLAFSQAESPVLGAVSLVAVAGLGILVALVGGLLARAVQLVLATDFPRRPGRAIAAALAAVALALAPTLVPRPTDGPTVQVVGVQGDLPPGFTRTLSAEPGTMLQRYLNATTALATDIERGDAPYPDLVIWPEGSSDRDPLGPRAGEEVQDLVMGPVDAVDAPVVMGATSRGGGDAPRNMMLQFQPGQGLADTYTKVHLAPFGEFMPLRPVLRHLSPWVDRITDFEPGDEPGLMTVPLRDDGVVELGLAICFEVVVDHAMRELTTGGAELFVVPTSNAWFGEGHQSVEHLAISQVRAVEYGRSVVHISNVGVSGLVTPDGVVHERTALFTADLMQGELPLRDELTLAVHTGPWVVPVAAVVVLGALVLGLLGRRRG